MFEIDVELKYGSEVIDENGNRDIIHGLYSIPIENFCSLT